MNTGATFSPDRRHRYSLWREWGPGKTFTVIGLNPSTADEVKNDPTMRRCIAFAKREGCGKFVMLNLFAYRSRDPDVLYKVDDPIGPDNDRAILELAASADILVAAWGTHPLAQPRYLNQLYGRLPPLVCFGLTKQGAPKHPLYLPRTARLEPYE